MKTKNETNKINYFEIIHALDVNANLLTLDLTFDQFALMFTSRVTNVFISNMILSDQLSSEELQLRNGIVSLIITDAFNELHHKYLFKLSRECFRAQHVSTFTRDQKRFSERFDQCRILLEKYQHLVFFKNAAVAIKDFLAFPTNFGANFAHSAVALLSDFIQVSEFDFSNQMLLSNRVRAIEEKENEYFELLAA